MEPSYQMLEARWDEGMSRRMIRVEDLGGWKVREDTAECFDEWRWGWKRWMWMGMGMG